MGTLDLQMLVDSKLAAKICVTTCSLKGKLQLRLGGRRHRTECLSRGIVAMYPRGSNPPPQNQPVTVAFYPIGRNMNQSLRSVDPDRGRTVGGISIINRSTCHGNAHEGFQFPRCQHFLSWRRRSKVKHI